MADKSRTEHPSVSSETIASVLKRVIAENGREYIRGYLLAILCLAIIAGTTAYAAWIMESVVNEATAGTGLDGIVNQVGGVSGIMDAMKSIDFPIGMDDLEPLLQKAGVPSDIVNKIKDSGVSQIDSPDDLVNLAKKFLG